MEFFLPLCVRQLYTYRRALDYHLGYWQDISGHFGNWPAKTRNTLRIGFGQESGPLHELAGQKPKYAAHRALAWNLAHFANGPDFGL